MKIAEKEIGTRSKEVLEAVSRGEEVIITSRGKPKAKIVPIDHNGDKQKSKLFGIWKDNPLINPDVETHVNNLRKGRF